MRSIIESIFLHAEEHPEKTALTDGKDIISYADLCRQILFAKNILTERFHLKKGDTLLLAANKQLTFVSVYFACHLLEVIVLPIAPDINEKRLSFIAEKAGPKIAIGLTAQCLSCARAELSAFNGLGDEYSYGDVIFPPKDSIADILFTTGTTGEPKGVMLSQKNIAAAANNINTFIQNTTEDVEMLALPISHSFGLGRLRCALSNGQTVVVAGSFANIGRLFKLMESCRVTGFGMVPASWAMIRKLSGLKIQKFASQLHYIEIGSAPMPIEEKKTLIEIFPNTRICMHYGLTEASRSAFMEFHEDRDHLDTVGRQSPNMYIEIRDEKGEKVPDNTEGEICVKGDAVTVGYYKLPEADQNSFWNDYFRTGDWGTRYEDGRIRLSSRKKELINVGGKKVSPIEIEEALLTEPWIEDCACVGVPDPDGMLGEVVKAYIVTSEPEKIIKENINKRLASRLEAYKLPAAYESVSEIPKTASGKVQRLLLKDR